MAELCRRRRRCWRLCRCWRRAACILGPSECFFFFSFCPTIWPLYVVPQTLSARHPLPAYLPPAPLEIRYDDGCQCLSRILFYLFLLFFVLLLLLPPLVIHLFCYFANCFVFFCFHLAACFSLFFLAISNRAAKRKLN